MIDPKPNPKPDPSSHSESSDNRDNVVTTDRFNAMSAELAARSRQQRAVAELGAAALTKVDINLLIGQACALVADTLSVDFCRVLELDAHNDLVPRGRIGWKEEDEVPGLDSEAMYALWSDEPIFFSNLAVETRFDGEPLLEKVGVVSGMTVRLPGAPQPRGVIGAYSRSRRDFNSYEADFMQAMANVLAAAIDGKRAHEALEESRAQIHLREKVGRIGSWSWSRGSKEWLWSDEFARLVGQSDVQRTDYPALLECIHPADRPGFAALIEKAMTAAGEHRLSHRLVSDDVTRNVESVIHATAGRDGKPMRVVGTTHELPQAPAPSEDHVRLSALIELAAREWRLTCDAIDAIVLVTDQNSTILRLNDSARRLLHSEFEEALGTPLPGAKGEPWSTMRQLSSVVNETRIATHARCHDADTQRSWDISARSLRDERFGDERIVLVAHDATEQERREQIRHDADLLEAVTDLLFAVARRVGRPLEMLRDLLSTHLDQIQLSADDLRKARSATHELTTLFRRLHEYSRPLALEPEPQSLRGVLEDSIAVVAPLASARDIVLAPRFEGERFNIMMNRERLKQLFVDMLTLFVERTDNGHTIQIDCGPTPWRKQQWVGIVVETNKQIFARDELRWMLEPTLPHLDGDHGLRMSIDARIVEEHGGILTMMNRASDGSAFASLKFAPFD